jgi:HK97 family phage portal protein
MNIRESLTKWVFKDSLTKLQKEVIEQSIGSEFYAKMLQYVQGNPVYMPDDIESYIKNGYLFNPSVYSIVSFIAQKAGTIPWGVYSVKSDKALNLYKSASHDLPQFKKSIIKTKALVELPNHDLNELFVTPNILQAWAEFIEQVVGFKLVTGNSYVHCIGPENGVNAGIIKEMWPLPSQYMSIVAGDQMQPIKQYELKGDRNLIIPKENVIHLKYWTPNAQNGQFLYGVSPIQAGRRVVTKSNSSYDASVSMFQNMGASGFISAKSRSVEDPSLTPEQAEMIEKKLAKKTGPRNAGKPLVTSVPLEWQQMGMSPVDLAIIESDKMDLRTICNIFHVPSELFNDAANKTYSNTKEAGSAVYTNAVIPALTQFRDAFNQKIQKVYGKEIYVDFDTSMISELQDDLVGLSTALNSCWWLTGNERRDMMSFATDEKNPLLDDYMVPSGLMPMSGYTDEAITDEVLEEAAKSLGINDYLTII